MQLSALIDAAASWKQLAWVWHSSLTRAFAPPCTASRRLPQSRSSSTPTSDMHQCCSPPGTMPRPSLQTLKRLLDNGKNTKAQHNQHTTAPSLPMLAGCNAQLPDAGRWCVCNATHCSELVIPVIRLVPVVIFIVIILAVVLGVHLVHLVTIPLLLLVCNNAMHTGQVAKPITCQLFTLD